MIGSNITLLKIRLVNYSAEDYYIFKNKKNYVINKAASKYYAYIFKELSFLFFNWLYQSEKSIFVSRISVILNYRIVDHTVGQIGGPDAPKGANWFRSWCCRCVQDPDQHDQVVVLGQKGHMLFEIFFKLNPTPYSPVRNTSALAKKQAW